MQSNRAIQLLSLALAIGFLLLTGRLNLHAQSFELEPITDLKTTPIYVNGRQVAANQWFSYKLEGIFRLEGYNLQKGSTVQLTVRKGAKTIFSKQYPVNSLAAFKTTVIIPDVKKSVKCRVEYLTSVGEEKELIFYFKAFQRR